MPLAGQIILAGDFTPVVQVEETTAQNNLSNTDPAGIPGSPECSLTFIAPTTGSVVVTVMAAANSDATVGFLICKYQVRQNDVAGAIVFTSSTRQSAVIIFEVATGANHHSERGLRIDGLTPGATYFVRTLHYVSGGTDIDLSYRYLRVVPTT